MPSFKVDFDALDWQSPLPGVWFKIHRDGARQIWLVELTSEFVEPDWCEKGVNPRRDALLEKEYLASRHVVRYDRGGSWPCEAEPCQSLMNVSLRR